ncbi:MAG: 16S rRNA (adenine(1518)-N(6)/adenine(1519)-N(6))-dimethyltransferase RsmA [Gammaproteobacteria bacterium]|nr:16S rRNA (adenine(1518)-N(6)/adenine(1519)-N(6))-dimethyltransferase RsmA [Gammaproteobacteria bacterium]MBV9697822.1 16S rRNA (adenine(1518)-N(6)/adenine(1519)-N(6))-dimethyltransferase RsmA [Gammaproteobacteria bacterium]
MAAGAPARPPRRKRFGQHFLHDPRIIQRILAAIAPTPADHLVEIGPGGGALTRALLGSRMASFDALEIDRDLIGALRPLFAQQPRARLHEADALEFDFSALAASYGAPLRLIGNLPYNISTPLLFHLLGHAAALADLHVMLQREVVARICAAPGTEHYGRLGVMLAPYFGAAWLFDVGPGAFQPPPRVWSAVLRLTVRAPPLFAVSPHYAAVVAAAFAQRRKTLRNALRALLPEAQIRAAGIDPGVRPETLAPAEFNALAARLDRAGG